MPPQVNATLTAVKAAGTGETYDGPPAAGLAKWTGTAAVYLRERRRRTSDAAGGAVQMETTLLVDRDTPPVAWTVGDIVTFTRRDSATSESRSVSMVTRPDIDDADIPPDLVTVTLTLTPA